MKLDFFSEEKLTYFCEKRKHGNTLCVAMMRCVCNENSFHFCFLWLLEASVNFMKDRSVLKGSVNDLVRKVAVWKSILSFLLPGT